MIRKWFEFRSISSMRDKKAKNMLCLTLKYGWIATKKFIGFIWKILNKSLAIGSADCTCSIFLHVEIGKLKHCGPIFYLFIRIFAQTHFLSMANRTTTKKIYEFPHSPKSWLFSPDRTPIYRIFSLCCCCLHLLTFSHSFPNSSSRIHHRIAIELSDDTRKNDATYPERHPRKENTRHKQHFDVHKIIMWLWWWETNKRCKWSHFAHK